MSPTCGAVEGAVGRQASLWAPRRRRGAGLRPCLTLAPSLALLWCAWTGWFAHAHQSQNRPQQSGRPSRRQRAREVGPVTTVVLGLLHFLAIVNLPLSEWHRRYRLHPGASREHSAPFPDEAWLLAAGSYPLSPPERHLQASSPAGAARRRRSSLVGAGHPKSRASRSARRSSSTFVDGDDADHPMVMSMDGSRGEVEVRHLRTIAWRSVSASPPQGRVGTSLDGAPPPGS